MSKGKFKVRYKMEVVMEGYFNCQTEEEAQSMWDNGSEILYEREVDSETPELIFIEEA